MVLLALFVVLPIAGTLGLMRALGPQLAAIQTQDEVAAPADPLAANVEAGILALADAAQAHQLERGLAPDDVDALYTSWALLNPGADAPLDPYSGERFGYGVQADGRFLIWSTGARADDDSDDLYYASPPLTPPVGAGASQ